MMRRTALAYLLLLLLLTVPVSAQTPGQPTTYRTAVYNAGTNTQPIPATTITVTAALCNQAQPASAPSVNPTRWIWNDPAIAGRACIFTDPALSTLPATGSFEATLTAINAGGEATTVARVPFTRVPPPPAAPAEPSGLRLQP